MISKLFFTRDDLGLYIYTHTHTHSNASKIRKDENFKIGENILYFTPVARTAQHKKDSCLEEKKKTCAKRWRLSEMIRAFLPLDF